MHKNVKSTAMNHLGYTGIVKLSQYIGNKKIAVAEIHNEGGMALFNFLTDCLVGDFDIAKSGLELGIRLLNADEEGTLSKLDNTDFIFLLSKPEKVYSETEGIVQYSFIIPQEYFAGTNFNAIGLYLNRYADIDDYAAYCEVDTSNWSISISSVLVLNWELHISN